MQFSNDLISIFFPAWLLILAGFGMAFIITYLSIPPIVTVARAKGLYDMPNGRTSHLHATPYLGGVAVFTGLILSSISIAAIGFDRDLAYIIAGLVILLFIGLKDDMLMINPIKKLFGQVLASGIIVVLGNIRIDNFYGILGIDGIPYFYSILFTIFVFIVIINGINLIDGIDGLASGVGIVISTTFGIWFWLAGIEHYAVLSFSLAGSLIAFFYYNVFSRRNKIFLGDAGSLMIGLTIAVLTIRFLTFQTESLTYNIHSAPAVAFGILIIPFFDTLRVFSLRIYQKRSPFSADRQHMHHVLLDLGFTHLKASLIIITVNIVFVIIAFSLQNLRSIYLIGILLIIAGSLSYFAIFLLQKKRQEKYNADGQEVKQVTIMKVENDKEYYEKGKSEFKKRRKMHFSNILNV